MADRGTFGGTSFGAGWPGDVLRRLVGARGKWTPPDRFAPFTQPTAEIRPYFPWEFFQARWTRGAISMESPAVAGQFSKIFLSMPAGVGRYALYHNFQAFTPSAISSVKLYVNQAFFAPTKGAGVLDSRLVAAGSWLTPMIAGMAAAAAAGLPAAADEVFRWAPADIPRVPPILLAPGTTVMFAGQVVLQAWALSCEVWEIPQDDIDG